MIATQVRRMSGGRLLSLVLLGGIALSGGAGYASPLPQAHTTPRYSWTNFDGQWFCRSWSDTAPDAKVILPGATSGVAHAVWEYDLAGGHAYNVTGQATTQCTMRWHVDGALRLISDDVVWAPNPSGEWPAASDLLSSLEATHQVTPRLPTHTIVVKHRQTTRTTPSHTSGTTTSRGSTLGSTSTGGSTSGGSSGGYNPWAPVPGHPTYRMSDFAGDPYASSFGVCTWYAWYRHRSEPLASFGSAINWISAARSHGLATGTQPVAGATVVFSPGIEGAGGGGHAAHVEQVLGGGWFIISEMNFYWNGGGWGRVDYRYVYVRSGVNFIY